MLDVSDLIGIPYFRNGRDKSGLDCYGLAVEVERRLGKNLFDLVYLRSQDLKLSSENIPSLNLKPSDYVREGTILEIENPLHIAVALNKKEMIHATEKGVKISLISNFKIKGIYEVWEN